MKKQTKSNLLISLQSLLAIFTIFFVMAFACGDSNPNESTTGDETAPARQTSNQEIPSGEYTLMSATTTQRNGTPYVNTNVSGSLTINDNGTYDHSILIGNSPSGCGPGTYRISGDTIILTPDNTNCNANDWKYIYDAQMNRLSLRDKDATLLYCVAGKQSCFKEN